MPDTTGFVEIEQRAVWTKAGPVVSRIPMDEIAALEERTTATVGDPAPLGLWAFATGTWMMGTVIGGVFPAAGYAGVVPSLLVFAGIAQFIAGLFAFRRADSLNATAFCCFGAFNTAAAMTFLLAAMRVMAFTGAVRVLTGFFLESFAFIAFALMIAAMRRNTVLVAFLGLLGIGYALAGIPDLANAGGGGWIVVANIGGWFLVASAFCAYYAGMALVVNSTWKRTVLPIFGEP